MSESNPTDKLRAIVEGKWLMILPPQTPSMGYQYVPDDTANRLAQTLLAVLEECDAIGGNIGSIRAIINTHMTEIETKGGGDE
jgi:hypothetical protein